jgi:G3E family GTPase
MIGGFLGAGKTTAIAKFAQWIDKKGLRVGLITNDQGAALVDTVTLSSHGFPVEEIAGGCFCCRFDSLVQAATRLTEQNRPDVFIAEPVGSCTDLVATVTYPLRRIYGDRFSIAPVSVLVDPIRASRIFGLSAGSRFSDKVVYIYRKQLEEADVIVINKCDLIDQPARQALRLALSREFSHATIFEVSARDRTGLEEWFQHVFGSEQVPRAIMEVDYDLYADGEARLGWLNAMLRVQNAQPADANQLLRDFSAEIQQRLNDSGSEVAHLKMTLEADTGIGDLGIINLVRNDYVPELSQSLQDLFVSGRLTLNLRAEGLPETLHESAVKALEACKTKHPQTKITWEHTEFFKPGRPTPTHRITAAT